MSQSDDKKNITHSKTVIKIFHQYYKQEKKEFIFLHAWNEFFAIMMWSEIKTRYLIYPEALTSTIWDVLWQTRKNCNEEKYKKHNKSRINSLSSIHLMFKVICWYIRSSYLHRYAFDAIFYTPWKLIFLFLIYKKNSSSCSLPIQLDIYTYA